MKMHQVSARCVAGRLGRSIPRSVQPVRAFSDTPIPRPSNARSKTEIAKMLRHIGNPKEVAQYLNTYSELDPRRFALIKVGGNVLDEDLDTLAATLAFLSNTCKLYPIVVHGAGPQISRALAEANISTKKIGGLRVTTPDALYIARKELISENFKLVAALEQRGASARPIQSGVFDCDFLDKSKYGFVGKVIDTHLEDIHNSLLAGVIPVIPGTGITTAGQVLNLHADAAATALAKSMRPAKVIYMTTQGCLQDKDGKRISTVELKSDYDRLMGESWMDDTDCLKLQEIKELLDELPSTSTVSIVDALSLPVELFSHQGGGTQVRADAEQIKTYADFSEVDTQRMYELFQQGFGAKSSGQRMREEYTEYVAPRVKKIYVSENYQAIAVVTGSKDVPGVAFLDKFAVDSISGNKALAESLWAKVTKDYPKLFWRSKPHFESNSWFYTHCNGSIQRGEWIVFWSGFEDLSLVEKCVNTAIKVPSALQKSKPLNSLPGGGRGFHSSSRGFSTSPFPSRTSPFSSNVSPFSSRAFSSRSSSRASSSFSPLSAALAISSSTASSASRSFSTTPPTTRVGLIGARGHTGAELIQIVDKHPHMDIVLASSRALKGQKMSSVATVSADCKWADLEFTNLQPEEIGTHSEVDVWVLALPNNLAKPFVSALDQSDSKAKVIDLSADYRFDPTWTYGLPERHGARDLLKQATRVSNPGCYATGMQCTLLPVQPLLKQGSDVSVFGVSGFSGAGTTPSRKNDLDQISDNLMPYSLQKHIHEGEVSHQLNMDSLRFMPHVAPWFRGISLTTAFTLDTAFTERPSKQMLVDRFQAYYADEPLVQVTDEIPEVRANASKHHLRIGGFDVDEKTGRCVMTTTLDNLLKGAATQCVQNINLMMGHNEYAGINH